MPRPTKKKMKFDEDSVNNLLQEIYNDSHIIRAQIKRLFTKWETKVKEEGNIAAIGDQIVKVIAAEAKNQDQKIMLLKFLKEVVFDKRNVSSATDSDDQEITTDKRNELINMVSKHLDEKALKK